MSSRGSLVVNGHVTTSEYQINPNAPKVFDAEVLVGRRHAHGLPDYSHTPHRKYIKENSDGTLRAMRIYGDEGQPVLEIGYHPEPCLTGNRTTKVLHYHLLKVVSPTLITRTPAAKLGKNSRLYRKYQKYLRRYGL